MPAERKGRAIRLNRSLTAILPVDWVRWNEIGPGDLLEIEYNGEGRISPVRKPTTNAPDRGVAP
jgi:hypothetical protein